MNRREVGFTMQSGSQKGWQLTAAMAERQMCRRGRKSAETGIQERGALFC